MNSIEKELVLVLDGMYLFPDRRGNLYNSAESIMNSSLSIFGAGLPVLTVHTEADRRSVTTNIISKQVKDIKAEVVDVPSDIKALYQGTEDETEAEKAIRTNTIVKYFESL